jgi:hypothetical protein
VLIAWPLARRFFGIGAPDARELALSLGAGVVLLVVLQLVKLGQRHRDRHPA